MGKAKALPAASEREVMAGVLDACKALGLDVARHNVGAATNASGRTVRFGRKGESDLGGTFNLPGPNHGKRIVIEVKRPGKQPSPEQWDHIHSVNAAGGLAFWVDDAAVAMRVLRRLAEGWTIEIDPDGKQWVTNGEGSDSC